MGCLNLPLLQRFPAQHMESRAQRFRLLRQGRQAPRTSLQNSSLPQSSSSVQTPDCYNSIKEKAVCHWTIKILLVKLTSAVAHRIDFYARELPARCLRTCVPCYRRERCADSDWQCRRLCYQKPRASFWWRWSSSGLSPCKRPQGIQRVWDTQPRSDAPTVSAWFSL